MTNDIIPKKTFNKTHYAFSFRFFNFAGYTFFMKSADKASKAGCNFPSGAVERDFQMRIDQEGRWYHEGGLIKRIELVKLFANVLSVDEAGQHWLRTPDEFGQIEVEDAPFIITALTSAVRKGPCYKGIR